MRYLGGGLLALLLITSVVPCSAAEVVEPQGLWNGPMQGETPLALSGAQVVDADNVATLKQGGALLLDVAQTPKKPENMAPDALWRPIHMSIPGAVWLAGAGSGDASPEFQSRFDESIAGLTAGGKENPIVVFCHPQCWGSWNAAKRLVMRGYAHVYWFRDGVEGWQEKFAAAPVQPDAAWAHALALSRQ
jgi:PQQ-dependent catabolism-associated CXXCW motif protein